MVNWWIWTKWSILFLPFVNILDHNLNLNDSKIVKENLTQETVEFINWKEFGASYLLLGKVKALEFDPDGIIKIVLREEDQKPEHHKLLMKTSRKYFEENLRAIYTEYVSYVS